MDKAPPLTWAWTGFRWSEPTPFHRGFLQLSDFPLEHTRGLIEADALEPVDIVHLHSSRSDYREASLFAFAQWVGSNSVLHLQLDGATNESLTAITRFGHFRYLSHLELFGSVSDAGMRELARWPLATGLRVVDLSRNPITHAGAFVLVDSPYLDDLVRLDLTDTQINADGR